jgi:hypothetical protein
MQWTARFVAEMSHCVTGALRAQKPILSTIFAKTKNVKPGIYASKAYKWIPGYGIFIKLIWRCKMAFDTIVTL